MPLEPEEITKIKALLCNQEFEYVIQGMSLVDMLCESNEDFMMILQELNFPITRFNSMNEIGKELGVINPHQKWSDQNKITLWFLCSLAKWYPECTQNITQLNLFKQGLTYLPEDIVLLTQLESINLRGNHLQVLPHSLPAMSIDQNIWESLIHDICEMETLRKLDCSYTTISNI